MVFKQKISDKKKTYNLPVVPVNDIVILPNTIVPIFIGRKKTISAVENAIKTNSDLFITTQVENGLVDDIDISKLSNVGTICKIAQSMKFMFHI